MQSHELNGTAVGPRNGSSALETSSEIRLDLRSFPQSLQQAFQTDRPAFVEQAVAQWVGDEVHAHILVEGALRVCWLNAAAERLTSRPNSLLIRNGTIRCRENRFDRRLRELIGVAEGEASVCCLHDPKSGENLLLSARRLVPPFEAFVGLTIVVVTEDFEFLLADLNAAFGLTRTELRVAHLLLSGRTAEQTAQDLGIALETIRTHIKRAYAKLGVTSRDAFFHKLAPFVIFLG